MANGEGGFFEDSYKRVMTGISINEISINLNQSGSSPRKSAHSGGSPYTASFPSPSPQNLSQMTTGSTPTHDNKIVEMIRDELNLEHHYIMEKLMILVIINADTINNTVLVEW